GQKEWNVLYSRQYVRGTSQIIATSASLAGPVSDIRGSIDAPLAGAYFRTTDPVTVSGWIADKAATSGLGIDEVDVWAAPSGGSPVFLGTASTFSPRSDI